MAVLRSGLPKFYIYANQSKGRFDSESILLVWEAISRPTSLFPHQTKTKTKMKDVAKNWEQFVTQTKEAIRLKKMEDARKRASSSAYNFSQLQPTLTQCVKEKNVSGVNKFATLDKARGIGKRYHRKSPPAQMDYSDGNTINVSVKQNTCVVGKPIRREEPKPTKITRFETIVGKLTIRVQR